MKKKQPQVRKTAAKTKPEPRDWKVGDHCTKIGMLGPYEITRVSPDGREADLCLIGTNFELFRVPIELIVPVEE